MQEPGRIRVLKMPSYKHVPYADCLNFEDNQFKKNQVDRHDQVISMMYATKQQAGSGDEEEVQTKDEAKPFELLGKKRSRSSGKLGELEMLAKEFAGGG